MHFKIKWLFVIHDEDWVKMRYAHLIQTTAHGIRLAMSLSNYQMQIELKLEFKSNFNEGNFI
jgi:hypothetical protein